MHGTVGFSSMHPSDQSYRPSGAMGCAIGIPYGEDLHFVIIALDIFVSGVSCVLLLLYEKNRISHIPQ